MTQTPIPPNDFHLKKLRKHQSIAGLTGIPFKVPIRPAIGARTGFCTDNVLEYVKIQGGEPFHCFNISVLENRFIDLEAHAIVKNVDGSFIDPGTAPENHSDCRVSLTG